MSTTNSSKLCMACSKWVPEDMKSCHCGHVFTQPKSINGKRFTEGRFYCEAEEDVFETKKKQKSTASVFYKERVTYMPGYSYEDDYEVHEKKERKRRRKKPMNLINESMKYHSAAKTQRVNLTAKDIDVMVDGEPLIQVLQEINNKITNQTRLWINLDS